MDKASTWLAMGKYFYLLLAKFMGVTGLAVGVYAMATEGASAVAFVALFAGIFWFLYGGFLLEEMMGEAGAKLDAALNRIGWWIGGSGFFVSITLAYMMK